MNVGQLQALLDRFAKLHRDDGTESKAKMLEDFSLVFRSTKKSTTVQTLVAKLKERGVGKQRRVR
jgi:hypothetical protein